jgi:hypothetical protein
MLPGDPGHCPTATLTRREALALATSAALPRWPALPAATALAGGLAGALLVPGAVQAAVPTDRITVLYQRESDKAVTRLDAVVQAATLALEDEMLRQGFRVVQPDATAYAVMDRGPEVIVTFAPDAGFSFVFSLYRDLRPAPAGAIAEVRLQARVFVGRVILTAEDGRGQMFTRQDAGTREFGERRAMELAAKRAAAEIVEKTARRLKDLSAARINEMVALGTVGNVASSQTVLPPAPPAAPAGPVTPPPPAAAPAPVPAASPVAAPAQPTPAAPPRPPAATAPTTGPLPAPANRWAVVAGVSDYGPTRQRRGITKESDLSNLPGVRRDVEQVTQTLLDLGFPPKQVASLLNEDASSAALRLLLKKLARLVGPEDLVVLFLSAHGAPKEGSVSGYGRPVLADDGGASDPNTLDFWELQGLTRNLPARNVLWVIDTCFSGNAARNVVTAQISASGVTAVQGQVGPDASAVARNADQGQNFAVITASASDEVSLDTEGGGLFTVHFLKGLRSTRGSASVEQIIRQHVMGPVLDQSRQNCRRKGPECRFPQQTPQLAFTGRGNQIRL